jgi:hypothetical protein
MLEKDGRRVVPLVMVGVAGPEMKDQDLLATEPPGSLSDVPVGAEELVGSVITLSGPALAVGGVLATAVVVNVTSPPYDVPILFVA